MSYKTVVYTAMIIGVLIGVMLIPAPSPRPVREVLFSDDFSGNILDNTTKWNDYTFRNYGVLPEHELKFYPRSTDGEDNISTRPSFRVNEFLVFEADLKFNLSKQYEISAGVYVIGDGHDFPSGINFSMKPNFIYLYGHQISTDKGRFRLTYVKNTVAGHVLVGGDLVPYYEVSYINTQVNFTMRVKYHVEIWTDWRNNTFSISILENKNEIFTYAVGDWHTEDIGMRFGTHVTFYGLAPPDYDYFRIDNVVISREKWVIPALDVWWLILILSLLGGIMLVYGLANKNCLYRHMTATVLGVALLLTALGLYLNKWVFNTWVMLLYPITLYLLGWAIVKDNYEIDNETYRKTEKYIEHLAIIFFIITIAICLILYLRLYAIPEPVWAWWKPAWA